MDLFKRLKYLPAWQNTIDNWLTDINAEVSKISSKIEEMFKQTVARWKSDDYCKCKVLYLHLLNADQELDLNIHPSTLYSIEEHLIELSVFIKMHKEEVDKELMDKTVNLFEQVCYKFYQKHMNEYGIVPACYDHWLEAIKYYKEEE